MKILIDARWYGLENAGIGRYTMALVDELAKIDNKYQYTLLLKKKYFNSLKLPKTWKKVRAEYKHYTFKEQIKLPITIYKEKPDLCHFPHFNVPILYLGKYAVTLHDMEMHKFKGIETTTLPSPLYQVRRMGYKIAFRNAVTRSKRIFVPSNEVRKDISSYYKTDKNKFVVTYEGVGDRFFVKDTDEKIKEVLLKFGLITKGYFFYNGNAYPHKNLNKVIKSIYLLNKKVDEKVLFVIASSRSVFIERLREYVNKEGFGQYVKLLGFVTDEELRILHRKSKAFVYGSLMEGFGLQGLEAMASGTLLAASNIPVFKEIYSDDVTYFDPNKPELINNALIEIIETSEEERIRIIKNNKEFVKKYSWQKMAKETLKTYEDILK